MDQNQLFPFERNRYYAGKLLTSADFMAEQEYMNGKRRFLNSLTLGAGIICGLGVFNLDDFSIMLESGAALDSLGREIVIENSVVKKLSAIEGYDSLTGSRAVLCLRYREEGVHPVYALSEREKDQEYECNRIREGYQLFLLDAASVPKAYQLESEFYSTARLYGDEHYAVDVSMPSIASCGRPVRLMLRIAKHGAGGREIAVDTTLQAPAFFTEDGGHELKIHTGSIRLEDGGVYTRQYWLTAQNQECESTSVITREGDIRILAGGQAVVSESRFNLRTSIQAVLPDALVTKEIGRINLEMHLMGQNMDFVPLTEITLERSDQACLIDRVDESRVRRYIPLPSQETLRNEYASCFREELPVRAAAAAGKEEEKVKGEIPVAAAEPVYATGVLEIPLGVNARKGMVKRSGEIIHGLGRGDVYVELGTELMLEDASLGQDARQVIYGDIRLFEEKEELPAAPVETAVKVQNDKGSFVAAARLLEDSQAAVLSLRWTAVKIPSADDLGLLMDLEGKSITAETPTVVMGPGASHYFAVRFINMEPCSLQYDLTEEGSGEITKDGIYTAPAREGIFEVYISCAQYPAIGTYAYAVVKK